MTTISPVTIIIVVVLLGVIATLLRNNGLSDEFRAALLINGSMVIGLTAGYALAAVAANTVGGGIIMMIAGLILGGILGAEIVWQLDFDQSIIFNR
jgi:FtsH-binding integral membrane protein